MPRPEARLALIGGEGEFFPVGFAESRATTSFVVEEGIPMARVVLEEQSRSTHENAVYAKDLIRPKPSEKWILVTSAYHMPRALAELAHQLPEATLVPYPVVSDRLRIEPWWSNGATTRLVLSEYLKFLAAKVRMRFDSWTGEASAGELKGGSR